MVFQLVSQVCCFIRKYICGYQREKRRCYPAKSKIVANIPKVRIHN